MRRSAAVLASLLFAIAPARAGIGGGVTLVSNDMFRGRSISAGRPAASAALSYDDRSGLYGGVSASGQLARGGDAQLYAVQEYAGFARRIGPGLSLDLGVLNTNYTRYWSGGRAAGYTEVHAGLAGRRLAARIHFSPNYLRAGWRTVYGGVDYLLVSDRGWEIGVHGGALLWVAGGRPAGANFAHYDWQVSAARRIGSVQIRAGWAQGGPQADYYDGHARHRGSPLVSVSAAF